MEGSHAAGDFLADLGHADFSLGSVVIERGVEVGGEPQVVVGAFEEPPGQGAVFLLDFVGRVQACADDGGVADQVGVGGQDARVDGVGPGLLGGIDRPLQGQEGVGDLAGPAPPLAPGAGVVVGHGGQLPQDVRVAQDVGGSG